jgi:hypothetical protein
VREVVVIQAFEEHGDLLSRGQCAQVQRWSSGTSARASSMCWPQPAHVGLPQEGQVI